jgi:hypothetical protein
MLLPGDQAAFAFVDECQRLEPVPFDLEKPFWMGKRVTGTAYRHGLELRKGHCIQYISNAATR